VKTRCAAARQNVDRSERAVFDYFRAPKGETTPENEMGLRFHTASVDSSGSQRAQTGARSRRSARRVLRTECAVGPVHSVMCALDPKASQVAPATDQEIPVARPIFFLRRRNRERALTPSLGLHTGRKLALDTKQRRAVLPFPTPCNCAGRKTRWHRYSRGPSLRLTNS
jgi:hypothetical protein